jgi:hypothetical protein
LTGAGRKINGTVLPNSVGSSVILLRVVAGDAAARRFRRTMARHELWQAFQSAVIVIGSLGAASGA